MLAALKWINLATISLWVFKTRYSQSVMYVFVWQSDVGLLRPSGLLKLDLLYPYIIKACSSVHSFCGKWDKTAHRTALSHSQIEWWIAPWVYQLCNHSTYLPGTLPDMKLKIWDTLVKSRHIVICKLKGQFGNKETHCMAMCVHCMLLRDI